MEILINVLVTIGNFLLNAMCFIGTSLVIIGFIYICEKAYSMQKQEEAQKTR